jgi:hypothetical protein
MGQIRIAIYILCCFSLSGCKIWVAPKGRLDGKYCYEPNDKRFENKINFDGYFKFNSSSNEITNYLIFYRDGLFLYHIDTSSKIGNSWGAYIISGDTIKAQYRAPPGSMTNVKTERWFKIIDKNTLEHIFSKAYTPITSRDIVEYQKSNKKKDIPLIKFEPYSNLPDPNTAWIKSYQWFWCDKEQYKKWKKEIKEMK